MTPPSPAPAVFAWPGSLSPLPPSRLPPPRERLSLARGTKAEQGLQQRFVVIRAPAGWGKTSLMAQWWHERQGAPGTDAWLTLHPSWARTPEGLLRQLAAAWQLPAEAGQDLPALWGALAPLLREGQDGAVLWLDQLEALGEDGPAWALWCALLDSAPPALRIVMATRGRLPAPLVRLRLHGEVAELDALSLAFTPAEVANTLSIEGLAAPNPAWLQEVMARTEGWPLAVMLLARDRSYMAGDSQQALAALSGEQADLWGYLRQEVWDGLPEGLQVFLQDLAGLDRICADLCNAVRRQADAAAWLEQCEQHQLFLRPLDCTRDWYRLHPLFSQFLRRLQRDRADRTSMRAGALRAVDWLLARQHFTDAFELALRVHANDRAAEVLEASYDAMFMVDSSSVLEMAQRLPESLRTSHPRIQLAMAMRTIVQRRFEETRRQLASVQSQIDTRVAREGETAATSELRNLLLHRQMLLSTFEEDMPAARLSAEQLLEQFPDAPAWIKLSFFSTLLSAHCDVGRFDAVEELAGRAARCAEASQATVGMIYVAAALAQCYLETGRTEAAARTLEQALANTREQGRQAFPAVLAVAGLQLAEVFYETGQLGRARTLLEQHLPHSGEHCPGGLQVAGWLTQMRWTRARRGTEAALAVADEAIVQARQRGFKRLELAAQVERLRLALHCGRPDLVALHAAALNLPTTRTPLLPQTGATVAQELMAIAWLQVAKTRNELAAAIGLARHWANHHTRTGAVRQRLRWTIELAQLQLMDGDVAGAQRSVRRAVELGCEGKLMRSLLDEPSCCTLLVERPEIANGLSPAAAAFHARLVDACDSRIGGEPPLAVANQTRETPVTRALRAGEIEVLKFVAKGYANREIAEALGRTEASIKWYLQQVYDKLGTRRRRQALERAKRLGLIEP